MGVLAITSPKLMTHTIYSHVLFSNIYIIANRPLKPTHFLFTNHSDFCLTSVSVQEKDNFSCCIVSKPTMSPCKVETIENYIFTIWAQQPVDHTA